MRPRRRSPPKEGVSKLRGRERLQEVRSDSELLAAGAVARPSRGRERDHHQIGVAGGSPDVLRELEAAHAGHVAIDQSQIDRLSRRIRLVEDAQGLFTAARHRGPHPHSDRELVDDDQVRFVVVHGQRPQAFERAGRA